MPNKITTRILLILSFLIFAPYASAQEETENKQIHYKVIFEESDNLRLKGLLKKISALAADGAYVPLTTSLLKERAEDDLPQLLSALHSRGYYSANISVELNEKTDPIEVVYKFNSGKRYIVSSEHITILPPTPANIKLPDAKAKKMVTGKPAEAVRLQEAAKTLRQYIAKNNCLLAVKVAPALKLDSNHKVADAYFEVEAGPEAKFGALTITGNKKVNDKYIRRIVPWKEGECFKAQSIDDTQATLLKSQLFSTVEIKHADVLDEKGEVPVTIEVAERFQRTIKFGLSYRTDEGLGTTAGWENRNLLGGGEKLDARAIASSIESSVETNYTEPYFMRRDQSLKIGARAARETPDQYTSKNTSVQAAVERILNKNLLVGLGTGFRLSDVESVDGQDTYGLISVPTYSIWDSRDSLLEPKKGIAMRVEATPYFDILGSESGFFRSLASGSTYLSMPWRFEPTIALRGAMGSIVSSTTRAVPADIRFYAGGGSSVRGYGYQELSPLKNGTPVGGRALLEVSSEFRFKMTKTIGAAAFIDGGNSFDNVYPSFSNGMYWGAGIGARYYSGIGLIRIDIAVPLDKRPSDSPYQLYVSLGEAF